MRVISRSVGAIALGLTITGFALLGCDLAGGGGNSTPEEPEEIWLSELKNPFVGYLWESDEDAEHTEYNFKNNGVCDIESNTSAGDFVGKAAYIVKGDKLVAYAFFSSEYGASFEEMFAYSYKIIDNNAILVTEGEYNDEGVFVEGESAILRRKTDSAVSKSDLELNLAKPNNPDNNMTGAWKAAIPDDENAGVFYKTIQIYNADGSAVLALPPLITAADYAYSAVNDVMILFAQGAAPEAFKFANSDSNSSVMVTEIESMDETTFQPVLGATVEFEPIW
jgi:hypothetical protein